MTEYVYRVVNEDGSFAKPVGQRGSYPGQSSSAKGLYTTLQRANAAIRGGIGSRIQRSVVEWEDVE